MEEPLSSLSQPHSSSSNNPALIGLHPHLLSLTTSSTQSLKRYRCTWSGTAVSQHTSLHLNCICGQLSLSTYSELIPGTTLSFSPCHYLPVSQSTAEAEACFGGRPGTAGIHHRTKKSTEHTEPEGALAPACREEGQLASEQEVLGLIGQRETPLGRRSQRSVGTLLACRLAWGALMENGRE
ncbi:hypothetical protein JOB18_041987 [Solea senegalensis]|uniref:Uncharacterized protein n=1 Tax=Solea senegalensis TaxID=28829 RepID=A0AAV6SP71_SOLSE|nr:hypothetical protein JOB18_041987 [Solea senegalensis]